MSTLHKVLERAMKEGTGETCSHCGTLDSRVGEMCSQCSAPMQVPLGIVFGVPIYDQQEWLELVQVVPQFLRVKY